MKTITAICIFTLSFFSLKAQIDERVEKSFKTGSSPELSIRNSFGDIKINRHSGDIIEVLVEISVIPSKKKDMDRVKDKIRIDIKEDGRRVELRTINDLNGISTEELDIDYTVKIPKNTSLEINNQFGNVWIEGTDGKIYGRVQHGDFFAGPVGGKDNSVKVQFGELRLESIQDAELEVHHGDFQADKLTDVDLEIQFSDGDVDEIHGKMEVDVQHSDFNVERVSDDVTDLEIDAQFSDINMESGDWSKFHMELEGGFADFTLPSSMKSLINYESKGMHTVEYRINEQVTDRHIKIDANHSDVDFD